MMIRQMAIAALALSAMAACGGEEVLGECVEAGQFVASYELVAGSDPNCPALDDDRLDVRNGSLRDDCDPDCECDVAEFGSPTCAGSIRQTCDEAGQSIRIECGFDVVTPERFVGSCDLELAGQVNASCRYDFVAARDE